MLKVDLHVHTDFSDGNLPIGEVLKLASELDIQEISITDHDTIGNLRNYKELESKYKIRIIPGVEVTANISGMHILGYGVKDFDMVENYLYKLKIQNEEQNKETIRILQSEGIDISFEQVKAIAISEIITHRDIVRYMVKRGYAHDSLETYKKFIGKGNKAYIPAYKASLEDVLQLIKNSGGISVLAHPYTLAMDTNFDTLIPYMKKYGLKGIEANTMRHTTEQKLYFKKIAKRYHLLETVGTDFHQSSTDTMGVNVEDDFLNEFHEVIKM